MRPRGGVLRALWIWGPVAAYVFIIFYLSSQSQIPWAAPYPDDLSHALEYAGLAVLIARALNGGLVHPIPKRHLATTLLLCASCGAADELYQRFTPDRFSDVRDLLSDTAGAALALATLWLLQRARRRRPEP